MALAWCERCQQLVGITPNGADPKLTNKRQRLDVHPRPDPENPEQKIICKGSGDDV